MSIQYNRKTKTRTRKVSSQDGTVMKTGVSTTVVEISRPLAIVARKPKKRSVCRNVQVTKDLDFGFNFDLDIWPTRHPEEHPIIQTIRQGVLQYRLQSAAHFDIYIDVHQIRNPEAAASSVQLTRSFKIEVLFHDFNQQRLYRTCRLRSSRKTPKIDELQPDMIKVPESVGYIPLQNFLRLRFPVLQQPVKPDSMWAWWAQNGRTFNWAGLPTELKERIVYFCMHMFNGVSHQNGSMMRYLTRSRSRQPKGREVTDQLESWSALLRVNRQMRIITLRLCFVGIGDMNFPKGLCLVAGSYFEFRDSLRRLGKCLQLLEPDSMPNDDRTHALSKTYEKFPMIYPELSRYATFRHAIRRIRLQMDFLSYLHFFKVTTAGFERYWRPTSRSTTYEVFQQLPHLTELVILLPDIYGRLEDQTGQPGPPLFYDEDFACPRIIHRLIYEQAAEVLTQYKDVAMYGFIDGLEKDRFKTLRNNAIKASKFQKKDLEELYADNGGGIELEENFVPDAQVSHTEVEPAVLPLLGAASRKFWPPKCRCAIRCKLVINRGKRFGDL